MNECEQVLLPGWDGSNLFGTVGAGEGRDSMFCRDFSQPFKLYLPPLVWGECFVLHGGRRRKRGYDF